MIQYRETLRWGGAKRSFSEILSRKSCETEGKLVVIANRKSYMIFQLVPKSVTLNDLERRNGPYLRYFTEFVYDVVVKSSRSLSHLLMSSL